MSLQKKVLPRNGFTFKQFFVAHDKCAMKVGTDGVLLGAWAPVAQVQRALDIGTGSGLLALMVAQRTGADVRIDGVEIEPGAAQQAQENVAASPWAERVHIHQADINSWSAQQTGRYQLIISNPPYFEQGVACASRERDTARYTDSLDHQALLTSASLLITEEGFLCVVLPQEQGEQLIVLAQQMGWHLRMRTDVTETKNRPAHRVLLALSPKAGELFYERLVIRGEDNNYSADFCSLTQDFYLFM